MRRRTALQAAGSVALVTLTGCTALTGPTELPSPVRTDDDQETYWTFERDGDRFTVVGIEYRQPRGGLVPVRFHTWHREGTHLESFRLELRFGSPADDIPPDVYLDTFDSSPDPTLEFFDDQGRGVTVLDVADLGPVGRGSLTVDFLVDPVGWLPEELGVRIEQTLSTDRVLAGEVRTVVDDRIPFDVSVP